MWIHGQPAHLFIITTSFIKEAGITVFKPEAVTAENRVPATC
jgi:hypothetical protein